MGSGLRFWIFLLLLITIISSVHATTLSNERRLAILAANMLNTAGSSDYTLACGPKEDVLNTLTSPSDNTHGAYYCVMNRNGKLVFGTFDDATDARKLI